MIPSPTPSPDPGINWTAIGSGASAVAAIAAFLTALVALRGVSLQAQALRNEARRFRLTVGMENMWRLIEQWDHPAMRRLRARTAVGLLRDWDSRNKISAGGTDILNLFELVGYLVVRSETLRLEDAWTNFSGWALSWWHVYLPAIERDREADSTLLEDCAALIDLFVDYEARERKLPREAVIPTEENLRGFLTGEAKLVERLVIREPLRMRVSRWLRRR
jgi:hypothetical protein